MFCPLTTKTASITYPRNVDDGGAFNEVSIGRKEAAAFQFSSLIFQPSMQPPLRRRIVGKEGEGCCLFLFLIFVGEGWREKKLRICSHYVSVLLWGPSGILLDVRGNMLPTFKRSAKKPSMLREFPQVVRVETARSTWLKKKTLVFVRFRVFHPPHYAKEYKSEFPVSCSYVQSNNFILIGGSSIRKNTHQKIAGCSAQKSKIFGISGNWIFV